MKLYFEEYQYPIELLKDNLGDGINLSYNNDNRASIPYVGYYYNSKINDVVFILPKVFISENGLAFNEYKPEEIIDLLPDNNPLKVKANDEVVFELSVWLYQAIHHFYERKQNSTIASDVQLQNVKPMGEKNSKTIIEIILALRDFHKKHKNLFTYVALVNSSGNNKIHWTKTMSKVQPTLQDGNPYYMDFRNKNKVINYDEELISLFYSVLNYLSKSYSFKYQQVSGFTILKPNKIQSLIDSCKGTRWLKKIRRNYFTDELVELWNLLYIFFERAELIASGKSYHEKLLVSNFNLVFEDMIDLLVSDDRKDLPEELYKQQDGKLVDHIYKDKSLIDDSNNIYFIGDSKYYKDTTNIGKNSIYKQFTYAKNVVQFNIDVFNKRRVSENVKDCRYRDPLTEGYNITPNFFIRGAIDFKNPKSQEMQLIKNAERLRQNEHFFNRLFDRDTLFLQTYNINFMYVVASYVNNSSDIGVKKSLQTLFRNNFITFVETRFDFSVLEPKRGSLEDAVEKNFKKLNGKIYKPSDTDELVILALDKDKKHQFENLKLLSEIEDDFYVYDYKLGTEPVSQHKTENVKSLVEYKFFDAEENVSTAAEQEVLYEKKTDKYKRYQESDTILFGVYKDEKHLEWIQKNAKYNVRLGKRAGAVKRNKQVISAKYLVLYEYKNEAEYYVYKLDTKHHIYDTDKMRELEYPTTHTDNHKYYIYNLIEQTEELGEINVKDILTRTGIYEADGTPIYVYKGDLKTY